MGTHGAGSISPQRMPLFTSLGQAQGNRWPCKSLRPSQTTEDLQPTPSILKDKSVSLYPSVFFLKKEHHTHTRLRDDKPLSVMLPHRLMLYVRQK